MPAIPLLAALAVTAAGAAGSPTWSEPANGFSEDALAAIAAHMHREFPYVKYPTGAHGEQEAMGCTVLFVNLLPYTVSMFWDDSTLVGRFQGFMTAGSSSTSGSYPGHRFFFKREDRGGDVIIAHTIQEGQDLYTVHDGKPSTLASPTAKFRFKQQAWLAEYRARTGRSWVAHYGADGPRGRAVLPFWPTEGLNQRLSVPALPHPIEMVVLSQSPRVLLAHQLLSPKECALIIQLASPKLSQSSIGAGSISHTDTNRLSRNAWLTPSAHSTLRDTIYPRLARLFPCLAEKDCAEDLQVVRYQQVGDEYKNHYDFFETGEPRNRFATLLIYLNDPLPEGPGGTAGGTSFPKAFGGRGLATRPPAGSAVLFYNMLPDGNGDRLSEHAGLPVPEGGGEKWVANLWIWDPEHSDGPPVSKGAGVTNADDL